MDFFLIKPDKNYSNGPQLINWYDKIETQKLEYGYAHTLPKRTLIYVKNNKELIFPNFVLKPFLLVTEEAMKVIKMYKKSIPFNQVILLESQSEKMQLYYLPFLFKKKLVKIESIKNEKVYCFDEEDRLLNREPIFKFEDKEGIHIVASLDLLESLLRRKINGFVIEKIKIKGNDYEQ